MNYSLNKLVAMIFYRIYLLYGKSSLSVGFVWSLGSVLKTILRYPRAISKAV